MMTIKDNDGITRTFVEELAIAYVMHNFDRDMADIYRRAQHDDPADLPSRYTVEQLLRAKLLLEEGFRATHSPITAQLAIDASTIMCSIRSALSTSVM